MYIYQSVDNEESNLKSSQVSRGEPFYSRQFTRIYIQRYGHLARFRGLLCISEKNNQRRRTVAPSFSVVLYTLVGTYVLIIVRIFFLTCDSSLQRMTREIKQKFLHFVLLLLIVADAIFHPPFSFTHSMRVQCRRCGFGYVFCHFPK